MDIDFSSASENETAHDKAESNKQSEIGNKAKSTKGRQKAMDTAFSSASENESVHGKAESSKQSKIGSQMKWDKSRAHRIAGDFDFYSSSEDEQVPSEVRAEVQVHHRQRSFEEPILNEEDLYG